MYKLCVYMISSTCKCLGIPPYRPWCTCNTKEPDQGAWFRAAGASTCNLVWSGHLTKTNQQTWDKDGKPWDFSWDIFELAIAIMAIEWGYTLIQWVDHRTIIGIQKARMGLNGDIIVKHGHNIYMYINNRYIRSFFHCSWREVLQETIVFASYWAQI